MSLVTRNPRTPTASTAAMLLLPLLVLLGGCATFHYETVGSRTTQCGAWSLQLFTGYEDKSIVELSAVVDTAAGVVALRDEILQVDSLVVTTASADSRQVLKAAEAAYKWKRTLDAEGEPGSAAAPCRGGGDSYTVEVLGPQRLVGAHVRVRICEQPEGPARWENDWEYRLIELDTPCPIEPAAHRKYPPEEPFPIPDYEPPPARLADLPTTTFEALLAEWSLPQHVDAQESRVVLETLFRGVDQSRWRRLEFHLRVIDRRSGQVLRSCSFGFDQERKTRLELPNR